MLSRSVRERPGEAALIGLFALWSVVPLVYLLGPGRGDVFNGSDGLQVDDHLQYLSFVRDAGENVLQSNLFDVVPDPHLFFHPVFALSGLLWSLGVSIQLSLLVWKPVAVLALAVGFAAYVRRVLGERSGGALAALALALFYFAPAAWLADWLGGDETLRFGTLVVALEPYVANYPWGGVTGSIGVACMPLFLLAIERALDPERRRPPRSARHYVIWAGVAGLTASWLHPWQGIILLLIVGGLWAWDRFDRRYLALAPAVVLTAAPLIYLFVLGKTDSSWAYVSRDNDYSHVGIWLVLGLLPATFALLGYRGRARDLQERALRIWPAAALLLYFVLQSSWFYHAFSGLSLPLAILAVRGWERLRLPRPAAVAAILALTLPGMAFVLLELRESRAQHYFTSDERSALSYLDLAAREGAVLAPQMPLGVAVPGFTGRKSYVGNYFWTPGYGDRKRRADDLFSGRLDRAGTRALLRDSRAVFLAADCNGRADLGPLLEPWLHRVTRFGCATVYELRPSALQAQITPAS